MIVAAFLDAIRFDPTAGLHVKDSEDAIPTDFGSGAASASADIEGATRIRLLDGRRRMPAGFPQNLRRHEDVDRTRVAPPRRRRDCLV
ncbi:MAG TPA: hypothetical protein VHO67_14585 [Polyangia bacterium]|nr:hypothetical protein [Polyangia bacterium]